MAMALLSAVTGVPVRQDLAMTGEITLRGKVLPVGGIKDKILAAYRVGIREVILPEENEKDLEDIPEDVRSAMQFHLVKHMDEVIPVALDGAAADGAAGARAERRAAAGASLSATSSPTRCGHRRRHACAPRWRTTERARGSALPQVAFAGRSNVGKSSLLNALFGRRLASVVEDAGEDADDQLLPGQPPLLLRRPARVRLRQGGADEREEWGRSSRRTCSRRSGWPAWSALIDIRASRPRSTWTSRRSSERGGRATRWWC